MRFSMLRKGNCLLNNCAATDVTAVRTNFIRILASHRKIRRSKKIKI